MSMKVFVTGGAGYIGSHVVRHLLRAGHDVLVYDNLSTGHRQAITSVPLALGDLTDTPRLRQALSDYRPDAVMHFAGLISVSESARQPERYFRVNTLAGLSLLSLMRDLAIPRIVFSSTAAVYGAPREVPIPESHPLAPISPYGASKLAFEHMLSAFSHAHGLGFIALRYFNAAGADPAADIGEDHPDESHLIPLVLRAALHGGPPLNVFGNRYPTPDGTCVRDYIHVADLANAHLLALESNVAGVHRVLNLGSGEGFSVREVIDVCREVTGHPIPDVVAPRRAGDPAVLVASSEKAVSELGWTPIRTELRTIVEDAWAFTSALGDRAHSARR